MSEYEARHTMDDPVCESRGFTLAGPIALILWFAIASIIWFAVLS